MSPVHVAADEEGEVVDDGAHTSHSEGESVLSTGREAHITVTHGRAMSSSN